MEHTILIIDDDVAVARSLARDLRADGYTLVCAENGAQALAVLEQQRIDLALIDVSLPDTDGIELAACMRVRFPEVVRFILTGSRSFEVAREAINRAAITHFAIKPWRASDLRIEIALALEKNKHTRVSTPLTSTAA